MVDIVVTLVVLNDDRSREVRAEQLQNISIILVTFSVSNDDRLREVRA